MEGQKALSSWRGAETSLLPLLVTGRPMKLLDQVVLSGSGTYQDVLNPVERR